MLDADATGYVAKDTELPAVLRSLKERPALVITDSQVFETVSSMVPADVHSLMNAIEMALLNEIKAATFDDAVEERRRTLNSEAQFGDQNA